MPGTYSLATSLHNFAGDFFQNVFIYSLSEAGTATPFEYAQALAAIWHGTNEVDYLACMASDVILDFVTAKKIDAGGGASATLITGTAGGQAGLSVSAGVGFDIAWQSGSGTNRPGHTYLAAAEGGSLVGGQWNGAMLASVATFINTQRGQLALGGALGTADFGIYSRKLHQFNKVTHGIAKPKPTMLNKRTMPVL